MFLSRVYKFRILYLYSDVQTSLIKNKTTIITRASAGKPESTNPSRFLVTIWGIIVTGVLSVECENWG